MALTLRTVTGTLRKASGAEWEGGKIRFSLVSTQTSTGGVIIPKLTVEVVAGAQGAFSVSLYTLVGSYLNYSVQLPNGESQDISLPDAVGDAVLADLLAVAAQAAEIAIRPATDTELGGVMVDDVTITVDASGVISAVGGGATVSDTAYDEATWNGVTTIAPSKNVTRDKFESLDAAKANLASPTFTGTPAAPTASPGTNTTQIATTAFIQAAIAALINSAPGALDTLDELAAALGDDANFAATITAALAGKLAIAQNLADLNNAATARTNLGLGNVNNTSDANKPVSTATQTALDLKQNASNAVISDAASPTEINAVWSGSQAQYDGLTPDANTLYFIV